MVVPDAPARRAAWWMLVAVLVYGRAKKLARIEKTGGASEVKVTVYTTPT